MPINASYHVIVIPRFCSYHVFKMLTFLAWFEHIHSFIHSVIHSIGMCRMRRFLTVLRSFFHFSLLYTLSFHPFPPTNLPSSLTSSSHLLLGLPVSLFASKFIYNTFLGILILSTCPNQHNLFKLIVSVIVGFLTIV